MHGSREGSTFSAPGARWSGPLGRREKSVVMVSLVAALGAACSAGSASQRAKAPIPAPIPAPPLETEYIGSVDVGAEVVSSESLAAPDAAPVAAAYARRYGIAEELALRITRHAIDAGVDPELAFRLVRVESVFKVTARGPQGALGLTQLMPGTARSLDRSLATEREILDPDNNLRVGFRYLRQMIERYDDVRLGLLAYNRGTTSVDRALRRGVDPENGYSRKVLGGSRPYTGRGLLGTPDG